MQAPKTDGTMRERLAVIEEQISGIRKDIGRIYAIFAWVGGSAGVSIIAALMAQIITKSGAMTP